MKQRRSGLESYDSTERNRQELERYRTMSMSQLEGLARYWTKNADDTTRNNSTALEILAIIKMEIAERIGKKSA